MAKNPVLAVLFAISVFPAALSAENAQTIVQQSFDYYRGETSVSTIKMTIHRPAWERTMIIKAWTKGENDSIFKIIKPPKDRGNGTLKKNQEMWIYNPKVNRVIKLPPSLMSQSWMGSDFSNNDLSKTNSLLHDYSHKIIGTENHNGKKVYVIKSVPTVNAPVVWGMQQLKIREDHIFLEEIFYDEELQPVKIMTGYDIQLMGGKLFPRTWKMQKVDAIDEYTLLEYEKLTFNQKLPDHLFTIPSLKIPVR